MNVCGLIGESIIVLVFLCTHYNKLGKSCTVGIGNQLELDEIRRVYFHCYLLKYISFYDQYINHITEMLTQYLH